MHLKVELHSIDGMLRWGMEMELKRLKRILSTRVHCLKWEGNFQIVLECGDSCGCIRFPVALYTHILNFCVVKSHFTEVRVTNISYGFSGNDIDRTLLFSSLA